MTQSTTFAVGKRKAPRIIDHVWKRVLATHNGDYNQAKQFVDRALEQASGHGGAAPSPVRS
jgi:hypothetical protein